MGTRAARLLQSGLMVWTTFLFLFAWLPLVRSLMDGSSYEWATLHFGHALGGAGTGGDFPFLAAKAALGLILIWLGWRRPNGVARLLLLLFAGLVFADALHSRVTAAEDLRFEGDTLGVSFPIGLAALFAQGLYLLLAAAWTAAPRLPEVRMERRNSKLLSLAVALLPLQYLLLSTGRGQEVADVAGVLLTIAGWLLLSLGLAPWRGGRGRRVADPQPPAAQPVAETDTILI